MRWAARTNAGLARSRSKYAPTRSGGRGVENTGEVSYRQDAADDDVGSGERVAEQDLVLAERTVERRRRSSEPPPLAGAIVVGDITDEAGVDRGGLELPRDADRPSGAGPVQAHRQRAFSTMPAATVSLVDSSIRMKLPVVRLRAYGSKISGGRAAQLHAADLVEAELAAQARARAC